MRAQQFIKDHGLEKSRDVVEGAPLGSVNISAEDDEIVYFKDGAYFDNDYEDWFEVYFMMPELFSLSDLKRLVESVDLVNEFDDLEQAKSWIDDLDSDIPYQVKGSDKRFFKWQLVEAVADYESIYGEGNE